jgi:hypothetical protein
MLRTRLTARHRRVNGGMPRAGCAARRCLAAGTHLLALPGGPLWMCQTHTEIVLELRKGRLRQSIDTARWRLRKHTW